MKNSINRLTIPLLLLFVWWLLSQHSFVSPLFLPRVGDVGLEIGVALREGLLGDIGATLYRSLIGLAIAGALGIPIGLLLGYSKRLYQQAEFTIEFFRSIPTTALFPLFLLLFGVGDLSKISMVAFGAIAFFIINTVYGVHGVRRQRVAAAQAMGLKGVDLFRYLILPEALPSIVTGFRLALSYSLVIAVVTEMFFGSNDGVGYRIMTAQYIYDTPAIYVGIITAGLLGLGLNKVALGLERRFIHWRGV